MPSILGSAKSIPTILPLKSLIGNPDQSDADLVGPGQTGITYRSRRQFPRNNRNQGEKTTQLDLGTIRAILTRGHHLHVTMSPRISASPAP